MTGWSDGTAESLRALVDASPLATIVIEPDATVRVWNPAAARLFGWSPDEVIGRPLPIVPPEGRAESERLRRSVLAGDTVAGFEGRRLRKDGTTIDVAISAAPIHVAGGGMVLLLEDVTQRKAAGRRREELVAASDQARREAEAANRAKDQFLAILGHELRNPLSAIRNAIMTARLDGTRRERALEIASRQADQLARLVDDLLDVTRITQGRFALRTDHHHLGRLIERAVETTRGLVEERGHALHVSLPREGIEIVADAGRIEQAVVNLLSNAAKYTLPGGRIDLVVERDGVEAVIRVRDSGIGIGAEILPRVFDLFAQADNSPNRTQGGLGIGLTLVKRLVELHGGRVDAASAGPGAGAEFVVRLPALPATNDGAPAPTFERLAAGRTRVVLVEDNPDAAESLLMLLELLGHQVRVFNDGVAALAAAGANPPDIMIVDIGLPGIDGYEVARRARKNPALERVVLVALTGYGRDEDRRDALAAGFDHHLVKPVEPGEIEGLVAALARPRSDATALH